MGPVLLGGAEGKKRFQHPRKPSYWWGDQLGQLGLGEEHSNQSVVAEQSETYTGWSHSSACPSPRHVAGCQCRQSIGAGPWGLMSRPQERTAAGCEETVKGGGGE